MRAKELAHVESAELIELHVEEKTKAHRYAAQMKEMLREAEGRRRQSEAILEKTSADLGSCRTRIDELEALLKSEQNKRNLLENELEGSKHAQRVTREKQQRLSVQLNETESKLILAEDRVVDLQKSHSVIQVDLEDSYSKLVKLAGAFQSKEAEMQKIEAELIKSRQSCEREAEAAAERNKAAKQHEMVLMDENNSLREKLKKAMKKLKEDEKRRLVEDNERREKEDGRRRREEEQRRREKEEERKLREKEEEKRRRRKEEEKRRREKEEEERMEEERRKKEKQRRKKQGPISYINQLHDDTLDHDDSFDERRRPARNTQTFETSYGSRRLGTKSQTIEVSFDKRYASGKENSIPNRKRRDDSRSQRTSSWCISR